MHSSDLGSDFGTLVTVRIAGHVKSPGPKNFEFDKNTKFKTLLGHIGKLLSCQSCAQGVSQVSQRTVIYMDSNAAA